MEIDNMIIYIILENAMEICQKYKEMTFKLSYMGKKSMSQATYPNVWTAKKKSCYHPYDQTRRFYDKVIPTKEVVKWQIVKTLIRLIAPLRAV